MHRGYIKLWRKIEDWKLYSSEPFDKARAWIDLLLLANHKGKTINVRGNLIPLKRGQIGWSEASLAVKWKWSRNKVRRFLNWLKTEQQIEQQKSAILNVITILNYEDHQPNGTTDDDENPNKNVRDRSFDEKSKVSTHKHIKNGAIEKIHRSATNPAFSSTNDTTDDTTERQQTIQQTDTNNNDKNDKNDKNNPPTPQGVATKIEFPMRGDFKDFDDWYPNCFLNMEGMSINRKTEEVVGAYYYLKYITCHPEREMRKKLIEGSFKEKDRDEKWRKVRSKWIEVAKLDMLNDFTSDAFEWMRESGEVIKNPLAYLREVKNNDKGYEV
ncbi:MAG: hypothetical protein BWY14_01019 [Parcubacteria group bacterium ADurb.Bin192]|nr:MAG: hypothetical protein BWY14_01019 [Parcubacteria group bacterium ADurb.Bin192]